MSDLIVYEPTPAPELPDDWDFEKADKDFDKSIKAWRRLTIEVETKAFHFYLALSTQGERTDFVTNVTRLPRAMIFSSGIVG